MFLAPWFALAGLIAAAAVVVIHLLNRQRYKVVEWAARDYLREAIFRNRRIMRLRDLLLLALRTLCLILFGMALARPFLGKSVQQVDPNEPVHAVLLVDNSLSMSCEKLDGTLLDDAKTEAKRLIDDLPPGSRISVLPTCGSATGFSYEAYYSKDDAVEALGRIEPVDRGTMARETIDLALEACRRVPDLAAKRVVLLTDNQVANWPAESLADHMKQLPGLMEVIPVAPKELENAWIADFKLQDGVADLQTPAVFVATIEYQGSVPQRAAPVTLIVDGVTVASPSVELKPGQKREVKFAPYQLDAATDPGRPAFVKAEVSVSVQEDRLPADDRRSLVVPVVATLPVVFVDQCGKEGEDPRQNLFGETFLLRRSLAPVTGSAEPDRQMVEVRHVTIDALGGVAGRDLLADARLVIIAGVAGPETSVPLLREYVEQGGNLVIAAGGQFDPAEWNRAAWNGGLGILPAALDPVTVGRLPEETVGEFQPFSLDYNSLQNHPYFLLEGISREEQKDLYQLPHFFKAVAADVSDKTRNAMVAAMAAEIKQRREDLAEIDQELAKLDEQDRRQKLTPGEQSRRADLRRQQQQLKPSWLLWNRPGQRNEGELSAEELADRMKFSVPARYTNGLPFLVHRRLGRGRVLFISTGVYPEWNTLPLMNTMLVYKRIFYGMLNESLPDWNMSTERQHEFPVASAQRNAKFTLTDPDGDEKPLAVDAVGAHRWAVAIGNLTQRGHYHVTATQAGTTLPDGDSPRESWEATTRAVPLAVNGPAEESRLVSAEEVRQRQRRGQVGLLEATQAFAVKGLQHTFLRGAGLWRWVMLAVLVCLLMEMIVLVWPSLGREEQA